MPHRSIFKVACLVSLVVCSITSAECQTLKITTVPPGAVVELDGVKVGITPFEKKFPGSYFHRPHTVISDKLEHPLVARISMPGYITREIPLTEGPMEWIDLHGRHHGQYWLFKADHFELDLDLVSSTFTGKIAPANFAEPVSSVRPDLSMEELVKRTKPAVVYLKALDRAGTGFFVTKTGVIATNAHLARGESSFLAVLTSGSQFEAKVVYVDDTLDIALAKVDPPFPTYEFPTIGLAEASAVHQGETVLAIGNPGDGMLFSVTQGIVSAVGNFPSAGPGIWIQTDAPINPGNSGGPLMNLRGEVVGLNTQKSIRKNVTGIGFALSASDLLSVLRRYYPGPEATSAKLALSDGEAGKAAAPTVTNGMGMVNFTKPLEARIEVDGKPMGQIPASLRLSAGNHKIVIRQNGQADCLKLLTVLDGSQTTVTGDCFAAPAQQ